MANPLPSLVDLAAFETWLRTEFTGEQETWAQAVLDAASAKVRSSTGKTWVDENEELEDIPASVDTVVKLVAARAWRNPAGVIHESTGPFSARYAEAVAAVVVLLPSDEQMLGGHRGRLGLWTLPTTRGDLDTGTVYVDVEGSPEPMPWFSEPI